MSEQVNKDNIHRLAEALKQHRSRIEELEKERASMTQTISTMNSEIQSLKQQINIMIATTSGSGATAG